MLTFIAAKYNFIHHDSKTCVDGVAFYIEESLKYV